MPADLTYPRKLVLAPGEVRDLFEDFQGYAELTPVGSTGQSGEAGEGQSISSGTAALTPATPLSVGSCTVSGTKLVATVTVPSNATEASYDLRWTATTSQGKSLSRKVTIDVKDV